MYLKQMEMHPNPSIKYRCCKLYVLIVYIISFKLSWSGMHNFFVTIYVRYFLIVSKSKIYTNVSKWRSSMQDIFVISIVHFDIVINFKQFSYLYCCWEEIWHDWACWNMHTLGIINNNNKVCIQHSYDCSLTYSRCLRKTKKQ